MSEDLCETIARKIKEGELEGRKVAVFHTQMLLHAEQLAGMNTKDLCLKVGMG